MARLKKSDIIEILMDEYGCEPEEVEGKSYKDLLSMLNDYETGGELLKKKKQREARRRRIFTIDPEEYIPIMNNLDGKLIHTSDRYGNWVMSSYGQIEEIPMAELTRLDHRARHVLTDPWIIILDPDAVKQLRLEEVYEGVLMPNEVEELFEKPVDEMRAILNKLTNGMKETVASIAYKKFHNGQLTDLAKIRAIEEICMVSIMEL